MSYIILPIEMVTFVNEPAFLITVTPPLPSTGPKCVASCTGVDDGDYQSCTGCDVYATCSNGAIYDNRSCPTGLLWNDNVKRCEWTSPTCAIVES